MHCHFNFSEVTAEKSKEKYKSSNTYEYPGIFRK